MYFVSVVWRWYVDRRLWDDDMGLGDKTWDWVMSLPCDGDMWHVSCVGGWCGSPLSGGRVRVIPRPRELWSLNTHKAIHHQEQGPGYFLNNSWIFLGWRNQSATEGGRGHGTHNTASSVTRGGCLSGAPTRHSAPGQGYVTGTGHQDHRPPRLYVSTPGQGLEICFHRTQEFYISGILWAQYMRCIIYKACKWKDNQNSLQKHGRFSRKESGIHETRFKVLRNESLIYVMPGKGVGRDIKRLLHEMSWCWATCRVKTFGNLGFSESCVRAWVVSGVICGVSHHLSPNQRPVSPDIDQ